MPNVALISSSATSIPILLERVQFPDTRHKLRAALASEPLEDGAEVSDHVSQLPVELSLEGWVSDLAEPIGGAVIRRDPTADALTALVASGEIGANEVTIPSRFGIEAGNAVSAWEALRDINRRGTAVEVVTPWETYPEMVIIRLDAQQEGRGMTFTMRLYEVRRVGVAAATLQYATGPGSDRAGTLERGHIFAESQ